MKHLLLCLAMIVLFSCQKENVEAPGELSKKSALDLVSGKGAYVDIATMEFGDVKLLIDYLDTCSAASQKVMMKKINRVTTGNEDMQAATGSLNRTLANADEPTAEELAKVVVFQGVMDHFAGVQDVTVPGSNKVLFNYDWTIAKQLAEIYTIMARDKFEVLDNGISYPANSRYPIASLSHVNSYIIGFAPGITWKEIGNSNYYNPMGFNARLKTTGIMTALGLNISLESERYVNAGIVYTTTYFYY